MAAKRALKRKLVTDKGVVNDGFFFVSENLRYEEKTTFSKGGYGSAFYPGYWKGNDSKEKQVYVKVTKEVDCLDSWKVIIDEHKGFINDDNVLKILSYEENINSDCRYRYFVVEWFDATLEQFCNGQYKGPMPSDAQVLCQIANGINHLHTNGVSHGNLNPQTILISQSQPVRVKVSDCGLNKFVWSERDGLSHPQYWRRETNEAASVNGDVFAAGCLLFYFLTRGLHPFGKDLKSILENISIKCDPVNLEELKKNHAFAYEPIRTIIGKPPNDGTQLLRNAEQKFKKLLPLKIDESNKIGRGASGEVVGGTYNGNEVAVKKVLVTEIEAVNLEREMKEQMNLDHENVLKLLHVDGERNKIFRYLVLELCTGTLRDVCEGKYKGPSLPPDELVLFQIAVGLDYIHSKNLVHRDIKPENILISKTTPVQMKVSDFGFCKRVSRLGTYTQSGLKGTLNWMAPEMLEILNDSTNGLLNLPRGTIASDIFSTGCTFFYLVTRGSHPFGNPNYVLAYICENKPVTLHEKVKESVDDKHLQKLHQLIGKMIVKEKEERIALTEVIQQLTALIPTNRQFKAIENSVPQLSGECLSRFHPTDPVLACRSTGSSSVMLLKGANGSIPFSNWRIEQEFKGETKEEIKKLEWNVNGTQLAAGCEFGTVIVWSYPSGHKIFEEKKHSREVDLIAWNPFSQDVLATRHGGLGRELSFWNSRRENGDVEKVNHFLTLECNEWITSVAWISANQIAIGLWNDVEICELDEDKGTSRVVKRIIHGEGRLGSTITGLQWNERTNYLAACSLDRWIKIWSMDSDQPVHSLQVNSDCYSLAWLRKVKTDNDEGINVARIDKENFNLVCGLDNGSVVIWNPLEEKERNRKRILPKKHSDRNRSLSFSSDGRFLESTDSRSELIIWSTETWLPVFTCKNAGWYTSWMSTDSSSVPAYKLAVSSKNKVLVVEQTFTDEISHSINSPVPK